MNISIALSLDTKMLMLMDQKVKSSIQITIPHKVNAIHELKSSKLVGETSVAFLTVPNNLLTL